MGCDFLRQSGHKFLQKIVDVQNQCFSIQITHTLYRPQFIALRKSAFRGKLFRCDDGLKPNDAGNGLQMIAVSGLLKGLYSTDGKGRLSHRLVDDPDTTSLHGLHIAVGNQFRNCTAHRIAGAVVFCNQRIFTGKQGLVRIVLRFDPFFDTAVNSFIFCFWHGCFPQLVQTLVSVFSKIT